MCGIAGYAGLDDPGLLQVMADRMLHRGPDDGGTWWDSGLRVGLAHRRLAIIDTSSAGHQPMTVGDGKSWIAFNGEIYDYLAHRARLEASGVAFRSRTDTEVLLHLYLERGTDAFSMVDGMFAVAIWDGVRRQLVLARDHAGVKPLYYAQVGDALLFASEIKALLAAPGVRNELNAEALEDYLTFLWVPGEATLLRGIRKLDAGHYLTWQDGRFEVKRWFHLDYEPIDGRRDQEWIDETRATILAAVRRQMVSDVPLGAFLSGGLDSSSIVAAMRAAHPERTIKAYTARSTAADVVAEQGEDDFPHAQRVAKALGAELKVVDVQPDVVDLLPRMVFHLDEPDADPAVFPSYLISRLAREDGTTVLLSGTGGDELFFGYRSHEAIALAERLGGLAGIAGAASALAGRLAGHVLGGQHRLARRLRKLSNGLAAPDRLSRHLAVVDWSGRADRRRLLGAGFRDHAVPPGFAALDGAFRGRGALNYHSHLLIGSFLAAHNFLYTDKSSMAASLEVRVPFLDLGLLQLAARMPEHLKLRRSVTKYVLKQAVQDLLPRETLIRPKTGFGAPLRRWTRKELRPLVAELLSADTLRRRGIFEPGEVQHLVDDNVSGRADHAYAIYALINLELWMRTFLDRRGDRVVL